LHSKLQNLISSSAKQEAELQSINDKLDTLCSSHLPQSKNPPQNDDQPDTVASQLQASSAIFLSASPPVDAFESVASLNESVIPPEVDVLDIMQRETKCLASFNESVIPPAVDVLDIMQRETTCLASLNESILQEAQLQMTMLNDQLKSLTSTRKQLSSASCTSEPIHDDWAHTKQPPEDMITNKLIMTPLPQNMTAQVSLLNKCIWQNVSGAATVLELNSALLSRVKQLVFDLPAACTQTYQSSWASSPRSGGLCTI